MFVETRERYEKRHNLIVSLPEGDVVRPPRKFEKIVVKAAEWIDDNPPPHVTDSNGLQNGMSMGARRFCSFGSSFVHGSSVESARNVMVLSTAGTSAGSSGWRLWFQMPR